MDALYILAAAITILGVLFVVFQLRTLIKQTQIQAYQAIYASMLSIDQFFIDHPDLKSFIYDGEEIPDIHIKDPKMLSTCEMMCDLFEEVIGCRIAFSPDKWNGWEGYMKSLYARSKPLKKFLKSNKHWYTPELQKLLAS